jgi:hypothetical protein
VIEGILYDISATTLVPKNEARKSMPIMIVPVHRGGYQFKSQLATCGLRISKNPTSDNPNPQKTTSQDAPDMGPDGAELSVLVAAR